MGERETSPAVELGRGRRGFDALRTERWISVIRLVVVGVVSLIYLGAMSEVDDPGTIAVSLLVLAVVYSVWCLVAFAGPEEPSLRSRLITVLVDLALVTAWMQATGGAMSEYWSLYLVVLISVAMRFDLAQAVGAASAMAIVYGTVALREGDVPGELLLHRVALMLITGFAAGVVSQQRLLHRRRGVVLAQVAEERTRELEDERAEVQRLRRVDVAKSEFVAVAAHEFRTPLAAVIGVLSTLREHGGVLTPEDRLELIDGAAAQAGRLARLVDDLLTVSRIEDGVLRLTLEAADPRHLLAEAAQTSGMRGRLVMQVGRVPKVRCDQDAIIRVLTNLLDNARKYSPAESKVYIDVAEEGDLVRFAVRDEGPGIPEDERAGVFERFRRLDEDGSKKPGAGLGLYICRGLIEAHGGTIGVAQAAQGGAEFSFTLPRSAREDEGAPADGPGSGHVGDPADEAVSAPPAPEVPSAAVR